MTSSVRWRIHALTAVQQLAKRGEFTAEDVWRMLDQWNMPRPKHSRMMGALMRRAQALGVCRPTGKRRVVLARATHTVKKQQVWTGE